MIHDYEQELTLAGGHDTRFAAGSQYGSKPYDLKGSHDAAIGEPLQAFMQIVGADVNLLTSLQIQIMNDTDGAGGSEVSLASRTFVLADLQVADGVRRVGICNPGLSAKKFLSTKLTVVGTTPTAASFCKVWLQKGAYVSPQNEGANIA